MNSIQTLALTKLVSDKDAKAARADVAPGNYDVDLVVRIQGKLKVGEDTERTPTTSIPLIETIALFAQYAGATREAALDMLERAMLTALDGEQAKGQGSILAVADIEATMEKVKTKLKSLPKVPTKGAVKPELVVEAVTTKG